MFKPYEIDSVDSNIEQACDSSLVADPPAHYSVLMTYLDILEWEIIHFLKKIFEIKGFTWIQFTVYSDA